MIKSVGDEKNYIEFETEITYGTRKEYEVLVDEPLSKFDLHEEFDAKGRVVKKLVKKNDITITDPGLVILHYQIKKMVENGKILIENGLCSIPGKSKMDIIMESAIHSDNLTEISASLLETAQQMKEKSEAKKTKKK